MDRPTILIVSDDPSFSSAVTARWQKERLAPAFVLMGGELCLDLRSDTFDMAIAGSVNPGILEKVLHALEATGNPAILVSESMGESGQRLHEKLRIIQKNTSESWLNMLMQLAPEMLSRRNAQLLCRQLQHTCSSLQHQAELGNYIIGVRHSLNNALTSILGNSELLLLDCESMPKPAQSQLESVRNMALRIHEILQRFSSMEKELRVTEKEEERNMLTKTRSAAVGVS